MTVDLDQHEAASLLDIFLAWFDAESLTEIDEVWAHQKLVNKLCKVAGKPVVNLRERNLANFEAGR